MANTIQNKDKMSNLWMVVLLLVITLGLYWLYWLYKNVKNMYADNNIKVRPILWVLGSIVPFLNFYLQWKFLVDVNGFALKKNIKACPHPHLYMTAYVVIIVVTALTADVYYPDSIGSVIVSALGIIYTVYVQDMINRYWGKSQ